MEYTIKFITPSNTYYLEDLKKTDVVDFKNSLDIFLTANYGFFSLDYVNEEVLIGYDTLLKSEIIIYKQTKDEF
jgi:hypothetical protein